MPTPTYTSLATVTLASSASSVTFSSIPATYRDLIVVVNGTNSETASFACKLNGATSNYSDLFMIGTGSSTVSGSATDPSLRLGSIYTNRTMLISQFLDYSATDKHKTVLSRSDTAENITGAFAGRYASTSAVTTIEFLPSAGSMASGTTFSMYGVIA